MTMLKKEEVSCPTCHKTQEITVFDTINATIDPELRQKLFDGEINTFKCSGCGHEAFMNIPLLYNDIKRGFGIFYCPSALLDQKEFLDDFSPDGKLKYEHPLQEMPKFKDMKDYISDSHIVFNMQQMVFYIVFREHLYDHYFVNK